MQITLKKISQILLIVFETGLAIEAYLVKRALDSWKLVSPSTFKGSPDAHYIIENLVRENVFLTGMMTAIVVMLFFQIFEKHLAKEVQRKSLFFYLIALLIPLVVIFQTH